MGLFDGFFDSFGIGDLLELGGTALGLYEAFSGGPEVPGAVKRSARRAEQITNALLNPTTDPMFLNLASENEDLYRRDYGEALRGLAIANNRAIARTGGVGFLNPERRDETVNDLVRTMGPEAKIRGREQARAYLAQALGANSGIAAAYAPQMQQEQMDWQALLSGFGALSDVGASINNRGMLDGSTAPIVNVTYTQPSGRSVIPSRYES